MSCIACGLEGGHQRYEDCIVAINNLIYQLYEKRNYVWRLQHDGPIDKLAGQQTMKFEEDKWPTPKQPLRQQG